MARKRIYRDYRKGHGGEFTDEATFNRSQGQGKECNVHAENVTMPDDNTITNLDQLFGATEAWDYEFDPDDFVEYEFHGTGDTGRQRNQ